MDEKSILRDTNLESFHIFASMVVVVVKKKRSSLLLLLLIHKDTVREAILWSEAITVDATYKTDAHNFSLVSIVRTSNLSSVKKNDKLLLKVVDLI